jgi:5-methylcytosine-specific restriction endonuclease McrA
VTDLTCERCGHQWISRVPNPHKCPACQYQRRRHVPHILRFKVFTRDNFTCTECGFTDADGKELHVHHIIQVADLGQDTEDNLKTLCVRCHRKLHGSKSQPNGSGYRSKSISLAEDVWETFDHASEVHGSYNKFLRHVFSAGGVFDPVVYGDGSGTSLRRSEAHKNSAVTHARPRKPLLRPRERK